MIADQEKKRRVEGKKKVAEPYKMSREGRPNPISIGIIDDAGWVFIEEMLQREPGAKFLLPVMKIR